MINNMSNDETMDNIFRIICKIDNDRDILDRWEPGNPVEWDSLATVMLIQELEDTFNINFEFEELIALSTWGKLKELVNTKRSI